MSSLRTTGPFERSDRLLDPRDFRRVLRRGRRRADADLVTVTAPVERLGRFAVGRDTRGVAPPEGSRLGITASRKLGGAVVRNRFKRRVREWFRRRRADLTASFGSEIDLLVIGRPSGARLSLVELDDRLSGLLGVPATLRGMPRPRPVSTEPVRRSQEGPR